MMRALVIDDQTLKFQQAEGMIRSVFPNAKVRHAKTFLSATAMLEKLSWDLVILDMAFSVNSNPSESAGFEGAAGLQVLQQIFREQIETRVIIFTAQSGYEDPYLSIDTIDGLRNHVSEFFGDLCLGCIFSKSPTSEIATQFYDLTDELQMEFANDR